MDDDSLPLQVATGAQSEPILVGLRIPEAVSIPKFHSGRFSPSVERLERRYQLRKQQESAIFAWEHLATRIVMIMAE